MRITMKFGFLGLDASGKTSFISIIQKKFSESWDPKPTKGIERSETSTLGQNISVWDYGGQKIYRNRYVSSKSKRDLEELGFLFYLVDIQNSTRFEESANYLHDILEKMPHFSQKSLVICFHKMDPKKKEDPQIQSSLLRAFDIFDNVAPEAHAIYNTSIFDEQSIQKTFSQALVLLKDPRSQIMKILKGMLSYNKGDAFVLFDNTPLILGASKAQDLSDLPETLGLLQIKFWQELRNKNVQSKVLRGEFGQYFYSFLPFVVKNQLFYLLQITTTSEKCWTKFGDDPDHNEFKDIISGLLQK